MPVYEWVGRAINGEPQRGTMSADSELSLRIALRKDGIILLKATEKKKKKEDYNPKAKINVMDIVVFTRQLSTMITSGLTLVQSLDVLANQAENRNLKGIIKEIKTKIEEGSSFAEALKDYPQCFDSLYVNLVRAGEEAGMIDTVLLRLATYMEKIAKLKKKIKSALIYPASIVTVAIGVVMVLLVFVIPVFETMFRDVGATLPAPTQFVVNLSKFVKSYILYIFGFLIVLLFSFKKYYATEDGKRKIDNLILKLPIFGVLAIKSSVARVSRTLATLLSSGVPILESLNVVAKVAGNKVVEDAILTAKSRITEGKSMSEPLGESGVFPPMVVQMVEVGESTGALDTMLNKVADFYEDDVDNMIANLMTLMEPIIMVFLGVVLGGLIIAMYLPIFQLGQTIK
ncbi:MAG: type II secretion system F family protein [Desulfobacterota bacterium]|nr:type II secretion system F family protein [Thermodesulfobacteriota bacterium]MDW8002411.1 type II secretion system F family protein [Deltaproteobacteria bacterium]